MRPELPTGSSCSQPTIVPGQIALGNQERPSRCSHGMLTPKPKSSNLTDTIGRGISVAIASTVRLLQAKLLCGIDKTGGCMSRKGPLAATAATLCPQVKRLQPDPYMRPETPTGSYIDGALCPS